MRSPLSFGPRPSYAAASSPVDTAPARARPPAPSGATPGCGTLDIRASSAKAVPLTASMLDGYHVTVIPSWLARMTQTLDNSEKKLIDGALRELLNRKALGNYDEDDGTGDVDLVDKSDGADHAVFKHDDQLRLCFLSVRKAQPDGDAMAEVLAEIGTEASADSSSSAVRLSAPNALQTAWMSRRSSPFPASTTVNMPAAHVAEESGDPDDGYDSDALAAELDAALADWSCGSPLAPSDSPPAAPAAPGGAVEFVGEQIAPARGRTGAPAQGTKRPFGVRSGSSSGAPAPGSAEKRARRLSPARTAAPTGIAGASNGRPAEAADPGLPRAGYDRGRLVAAALQWRGWTSTEVAGYKYTPEHVALLRRTHSADASLLAELDAYIKTRERLGAMPDNGLFVIDLSGRALSVIPKKMLGVPPHYTVKYWAVLHKNNPIINPNGFLKPDISAAQEELRVLPWRQGWEAACAPVAKKLLEGPMKDGLEQYLLDLTWADLQKMYSDEDDKTHLHRLRRRAVRRHQGVTPTDPVFLPVPAEMTSLIAYLRKICATHAPAELGQAGRAEMAGEPP